MIFAVSFVYAVIMMIIAGLVVYFVYGRKGASNNARKTRGDNDGQEHVDEGIEPPGPQVLGRIFQRIVDGIESGSFTNTRAINTGTLSLDAFTLDNYIMVFSNPDNYGPMLTSVFLGIVSVTLVIILILFACRIITKYKQSRIARSLEFFLCFTMRVLTLEMDI